MSQQINLYSPIFRKQIKVFSAATMLQGIGLIVLVVALFFYAVSLQTSVLEIRAAESSRQLKSELERLKAYGVAESPAERARALAERKKALEASLAKHADALAVYESSAGGRTGGYSEMLRALARRSMDGVWLTRIEFARGTGELSLVGRATRPELVATYLERLRSEQVLNDQLFFRLELTRPRPAPVAKGEAPPAPFVEFVLSADDTVEKK
jgi:Tfp pilus assembly protein PilN